MQAGVAGALEARGRDGDAAAVAGVPTANYVTGMAVAAARYGNGLALPAGAVELMARGGLGRADLDVLRRMTVAEANVLGLCEVAREFLGDSEDAAGALGGVAPPELESLVRGVVPRMVAAHMEEDRQ
jgi:hypothetical protein